MARSRAPIRLVTVLSRSTATSSSKTERSGVQRPEFSSPWSLDQVASSGICSRPIHRVLAIVLSTNQKKKRRNKINHTSLDIALCPSWETEVRDIHREGKSSIMIQRIPHWIDQYVGSAIRWDRRKEFLRSLPSRENSSPRVRDAPRRAVR